MTDQRPTPAQMAELSDTLARAARVLRSSKLHDAADVPGLDSNCIPLMFVLEGGQKRVGELAEILLSDISTVSRQVTHLSENGFADKMIDPLDRRVVRVTLTDRGHEAVAEVRASRTRWVTRITAAWSAAEVRSFHGFLERLAADAAPQAASQARSA